MVTIKNQSGRHYQAIDHGQKGRLIAIPPDGEREVSDEHAKQLLKDFPDGFKKVSGSPKGAAKGNPASAAEPQPDPATEPQPAGDAKGGAS